MFALVGNDPVSLMLTGGSPLENWIPSRPINAWNFSVQHINSFAPQGFTGELDYADWQAAQSAVGECDFADGGMDTQIDEYYSTIYRYTFSNKSQPVNFVHAGGMLQWENQPRRFLRGPQGQLIDNDVDWTAALLAEHYNQHMSWATIWGDPAFQNKGNGQGESLDTLISTGYVKSHMKGVGSPIYTDPLIFNGATANTPTKLVKLLEAAARKIMDRLRLLKYSPAQNDFVLAIGPTMWRYITEAIASGVMVNMLNADVQMNATSQSYMEELYRVRSGGFGDGYFLVDQRAIPVLLDSSLERNVTLANGNPGAVGTAFFLNRTFRGQNIMEQVYLDWRKINNEPFAQNRRISQNGAIRTAYQEENNTCFWMGFEHYRGMITRMQPLQARINSIAIETALENTIEAASFTHPDWYALEGVQAGHGTATWKGLS
jgi:hypothetical protein